MTGETTPRNAGRKQLFPDAVFPSRRYGTAAVNLTIKPALYQHRTEGGFLFDYRFISSVLAAKDGRHTVPALRFADIFRVRHMRQQKIQQRILALVSEGPLRVAPLAVILIIAAVWLPVVMPSSSGMPQHWQMSCRGVPSSVLMDTSNSAESSFKVSVFGTVSPVSQRETACRVTKPFPPVLPAKDPCRFSIHRLHLLFPCAFSSLWE